MVVEFIDETGKTEFVFVNKKLFHRFRRKIQVKQTKLNLLKLPNRISSPSSCISGKACLIMCEVFFCFYGSKPGNHFARNLREFGVARSQELGVNQ